MKISKKILRVSIYSYLYSEINFVRIVFITAVIITVHLRSKPDFFLIHQQLHLLDINEEPNKTKPNLID